MNGQPVLAFTSCLLIGSWIFQVPIASKASDEQVGAVSEAAGSTHVTTITVDATNPLRQFTDLDRGMDPHWLSWLSDPAYVAQYPRLRADGFEIARVLGTLSVPRIYTKDTPIDEQGDPQYDFESFDAMLDPIVRHGFKPMLIMNYVPDVLAVTPSTEQGGGKWWFNDSQVRDYDRWEDLIYKTLRHCQEKWGRQVVATWLCETWNEGDYGDYGLYKGRANFLELQDHTINAVNRADPQIRVGGPGTVTSTYKRGGGSWVDPSAKTLHGVANPTKQTSPDWRDIIEHLAIGSNYVTGEPGAAVDFISSHMYDLAGTVDSGKGIDVVGGWMMRTVRSHPTLRNKPVIISEWSSLAPKWPHDTVFEAVRAVRVLIRSRTEGLSGIIHHSQATPPNYQNRLFSGYPSLYTLQGPVRTPLGAGRALYNRLAGHQIKVDGETASVGAIASLGGGVLRVLVCYYETDKGKQDDQPVQISISWPASAGRTIGVTVHLVDEAHGNAPKLWQAMGSPDKATAPQLAHLMAAAEIPSRKFDIAVGETGTIKLHAVLRGPSLRLFELDGGQSNQTKSQ